MRFLRTERTKYGISLDKMSELSGLTVERIKAAEDLFHSAKGTPEERSARDRDTSQMFAIIDGIKASQDKEVEIIMGRLMARGIDVSLKTIRHPAHDDIYSVELSRSEHLGKSLSSFGKGRSPLSALAASIDAMREIVGIVAPMFPVTLEANTDAKTAKDLPIAP